MIRSISLARVLGGGRTFSRSRSTRKLSARSVRWRSCALFHISLFARNVLAYSQSPLIYIRLLNDRKLLARRKPSAGRLVDFLMKAARRPVLGLDSWIHVHQTISYNDRFIAKHCIVHYLGNENRIFNEPLLYIYRYEF